MSKGLYKFDEGRDKNKCQGFESFLHTLIPGKLYSKRSCPDLAHILPRVSPS